MQELNFGVSLPLIIFCIFSSTQRLAMEFMFFFQMW